MNEDAQPRDLLGSELREPLWSWSVRDPSCVARSAAPPSRFANQVEPRCRGSIEAYRTSRSAFVSQVTEECATPVRTKTAPACERSRRESSPSRSSSETSTPARSRRAQPVIERLGRSARGEVADELVTAGRPDHHAAPAPSRGTLRSRRTARRRDRSRTRPPRPRAGCRPRRGSHPNVPKAHATEPRSLGKARVTQRRSDRLAPRSTARRRAGARDAPGDASRPHDESAANSASWGTTRMAFCRLSTSCSRSACAAIARSALLLCP